MTLRTEQRQYMRLQYLRSLINNGQIKSLELEQRQSGAHRGSCATKHPRAHNQVAHLLHIGLLHLVNAFAQQMWAVALVATEVAAQAYKVKPWNFYQFAAYFVHSTVGVRQQQHPAAFLQQFLSQYVFHAIRGLARSRWTDNQVHIPRPPCILHQLVELRIAIVALERDACVNLRLALAKQHIAPFLRCGEQCLQTAVLRIVRRLHKVVLHGPHLVPVELKHLAAGLRIAQSHFYTMLLNGCNGAAKHHGSCGIGNAALGIRVEEYDVAHAEV